MLKQFNKRVQQDGILSEVRQREHHDKSGVKHKRKQAARRRKTARALRRYHNTLVVVKMETSLKNKLAEDLKQALRDGDKVKRLAIRLVMAAIKTTGGLKT